MANYFVLNNKFRPYSFDELIKPYQIYGQAYKEQEAILDAAREKEFSADYLDAEQDRAAYDMYNAATSGLKAVSDELATKGLSAQLRGQIRNTARDYKRTMDSLNLAQSQLIAERDRRAKLGPDYVYQQDNLRIGDFLNGASPNQKGESLSNITKDIATEFATRAKAITRDTWSKAMDQNGRVVGGYYDVTTENGLTAAQLDTILSDNDTWRRIMSDNRIDKKDKENLQRFRDVISTKKNAIGYDSYTQDNQYKIDDAIVRGASAGLGSVTHQYQKDAGYNPLGWAQFAFEKRKYNDAKLEAESPYTHSDEYNPSPNNRTGLKRGYSIKNGKLQYNDPDNPSDSGNSGNGTEYTIKTPGVTVHSDGMTGTYDNWDKANAGTQKSAGIFRRNPASALQNLPTVAIEDITDPDIKRALLNRINVPNANVNNADLDFLIEYNLPILKQLTVQISGNPEDKDYTWAISDKNVQRLTNNGGGEEIDEKTL